MIMQTPPTAPQASPTAPQLPVLVSGADQISVGVFTQASVNALKARGEALSNQLQSAQRRRDDVARELRRTTDGAAKTGLEGRLTVLDTRLAQLETDIAGNGRMLASAPGNLLASATSGAPTERYGPFSSGQLTAMSIVFIVLILAPLAIAAARAMLRRAVQPKPSPQLIENTARLERMEQAVDSIAVEIERISEGQRFVTGLMAKREAVPQLRDGGSEG